MTKNKKDSYATLWDAAHLVNNSMINLSVGNRPAIARDESLLVHANEIALRMVRENNQDDPLFRRAIENDVLLAESNQAELLADYGVLRRMAFRRLLTGHMSRMMKDKTRQTGGVALVMVDGNGLKTINDSVGHKYGDLFVKMWADQLTKHLRQGDGDIFFQYASGDELAGMLPFDTEDVARKVLLGQDEVSGRIRSIKNDIRGRRDHMASEIGGFPVSDTKEYGTLAIGWSWMSNTDLLKLFTDSKGDIDKMIGEMYLQASKNMERDKGSNAR